MRKFQFSTAFKFTFAIFILIATGCQKNNHENQFAGHWQGTYTGVNDRGTWDIIVDKEGYTNGTVVSTSFPRTNAANGVITQSGDLLLDVTIGTNLAGAKFTGTLTGNSASGNWTNVTVTPPYTGTWTGSKL